MCYTRRVTKINMKNGGMRMVKIKVVDAICGVGKTSGAINMINQANEEDRFLYITPLLDEVERVKSECSARKFKSPPVYGTKMNGIRHLLTKGKNIVSTHALFRMFDTETIALAFLQSYTLILDEVCDVVEMLDISEPDLKVILEQYAQIEDNGMLTWTDTTYEGKFDVYKNLCDMGCVSVYGTGESKKVLLWTFPVDIFKAFKEVYLLTYKFDGQIQNYYYDYYGISYESIYVKDFQFTSEPQEYRLSHYKDLIKICDNEKLNRIGEKEHDLSASWYKRSNQMEGKPFLTIMKKNCINFYKNIAKTKSKDNLWTCYKDYRSEVQGDGYGKGFASVNLRATNDLRHKKSVAYLVNRYFNPVIKNFFQQNGITVNEDDYALSELIQFIFRSRVRNQEEIMVYVPSKRMRTLLQDWLDSL